MSLYPEEFILGIKVILRNEQVFTRMIIFILIYSGAEIARVKKCFLHTLFSQVNRQSATITQSAQTTIPPNAPRLSHSKINGELYAYVFI